MTMSNVTQLLDSIEQGEAEAADRLLPLVYQELRKLAASKLGREKPGQTLQPTALVHEAYLRLVNEVGEARWENRGHFFAAAAVAMRRILVESARRKSRVKHGGEFQRVELDDHDIPIESPPEEILALDEALTRLEGEDADAASVVRMHFFAGLSIEDAAVALGMSRATAYRHWAYARAWLRCEMNDSALECSDLAEPSIECGVSVTKAHRP